MITIRALRAKELRQIRELLKSHLAVGSGVEKMVETKSNEAQPKIQLDSENGDCQTYQYILDELHLLNIPLHWLSQALPPQWQFLPALYVASSPEHVLGLIRLGQDGAKRNRWCIHDIVIDADVSTYDVGSQLVNFAINRYGGGGVQTFLAKVSSDEEQALGLFKSCGFRHGARLSTYRHTQPSTLFQAKEKYLNKQVIQGMHTASSRDYEGILNLYHDCLPPELRISLEKNRKDFQKPLFRYVCQRLNGLDYREWVIEDVARDVLMGWLKVKSWNYRDYHISMLVNPGWQDLNAYLLDFALRHIVNTTRMAQVDIEVYDFNKPLVQELESLGFERVNTVEVLIKDYWIQLKEHKSHLRSPLLIFNGGKASPAVNYNK